MAGIGAGVSADEIARDTVTSRVWVRDASGALSLNGEDDVQINCDYNNDDGSGTVRMIRFGHNGKHGSSTELMRIQDDGKVGIATDAPSEKLHVAGNIKATDTVKAGRVTIGSYMGGSTMRQATGPARIEIIGHLGVTSNAYVTGDVEVGGRVIADSVRVERVIINDWTLDAPDYVFEPEYRLRPLAEVEQHVKEHKHLPDVPSAAEMKQNGVDLAEMNMALLRKVEELMLYTIAQEKRIHALESVLGAQAAPDAPAPQPAAPERQ